MTLTDSNNNGAINVGEFINGVKITAVWNGDQITVTHADGTVETITGVTFYLANGTSVFTPKGNVHLDPVTYDSTPHYATSSTNMPVSQLGPPCFVAGTLIATPDGNRPVEELEPGDLVLTLDNGPQPLRWIGERSVSGMGDFAPIRFQRGALGNRRALLVSPQHRMLVRSWKAELFFGEEEVLVAAKHLVNDSDVRPVPMEEVRYVHLLFDRHEVIQAEGAWTESFHPGAHILAQDADMREEIQALFPELDGAVADCRDTARIVLKAREAVLLAA
ncbi:MAG: Hint domain-containing protein [Paracoccaceae bacterium]|nr:Hint domain-containing protein [Paracoccaceae bacterium]